MIIQHLTLRRCLAGAGALLIILLLLGWNFVPRPPPRDEFRFAPAPRISNPSNDTYLDDIMNSTLGFQKIFVINLPSRTDHRDSMSLAASYTGLQVEYVDGVTDVSRKALPPGFSDTNLKDGGLGAWRAHMNAIRRIVEEDLTSALVLEDDVDWDIRIKSQMQDFARASRLLVQPVPGTSDRYLDRTYPQPGPLSKPKNFDIDKESVTLPTTSPYGDIDRWDVLWIGHCGTRFPNAEDKNLPLGRAVIFNDTTVPEPQHVKMQFGNQQLVDEYPPHTRVVSRARKNMCTLGYALSRPGAQRMLYELGVHMMDGSCDIMFRRVCDGVMGRKLRSCLTVQPQLFQHHRPVGSKSTFSDISGHGNGINEIAFSRNIRWSTRSNFHKLADGETDYVDLFKDGEEARTDLGWG